MGNYVDRLKPGQIAVRTDLNFTKALSKITVTQPTVGKNEYELSIILKFSAAIENNTAKDIIVTDGLSYAVFNKGDIFKPTASTPVPVLDAILIEKIPGTAELELIPSLSNIFTVVDKINHVNLLTQSTGKKKK
jgi:hypothetical protein